MTVTEANHKRLASPGASSLEAQPRTSARHAQRPPRQRVCSNAQTIVLEVLVTSTGRRQPVKLDYSRVADDPLGMPRSWPARRGFAALQNAASNPGAAAVRCRLLWPSRYV